MSGAPWAKRPQNKHQKLPCNTHIHGTHTNWPDELVSGEPQSTSHITRVLHTFPMRTSLHVMILCDTTPSSTCINYIIQRHCDCVTWNCNRKAYKYVLFISNGALVAWQSWWGKRWKFQTSLHPSVPATSFFSLCVASFDLAAVPASVDTHLSKSILSHVFIIFPSSALYSS